ncbi:putative Cyclin fold protein [Paratrimastix pyriformis]|uniref:Cyclin fold protein n=1 Tax=Paratrimastix pyriformis TaxID=342808 RepID=A0ABQ8URJ7_9EUKA|nr:putative Cyclin fold protein [Paratrimastix pyriformis]
MSHGLQMNRTVQGVAAAIYGIIKKSYEERVKPGVFQGVEDPYDIFDDHRALPTSSSGAAGSFPPPTSTTTDPPPPIQGLMGPSNASGSQAGSSTDPVVSVQQEVKAVVLPPTATPARGSEHLQVPPPDFMKIYKHIYALFRRAQVEPECLIAALTYMERFLEKCPFFAITGLNWERLVFTTIMIASKAWDDVSCSSKSFCLCSNGSLTIRELNKMERVLLGDLDYSLYITAETYRVVYYDLKKIWVNMVVDEKVEGLIQPLQSDVVAALNLPTNWGQWYIFNCPEPYNMARLDGGEGIGPLNSPKLTPASFPTHPTVPIKVSGVGVPVTRPVARLVDGGAGIGHETAAAQMFAGGVASASSAPIARPTSTAAVAAARARTVAAAGTDQASHQRAFQDIRDLFERYGRLKRHEIRRSFAFVTYEDDRDAERAIKELHGYDLLGSRIAVEWTKDSGHFNEERRDLKCYNCGEYGHFARNCPRRGRDPRDRSPDRRHSRSPSRSHRPRSRSPRRDSRSPRRDSPRRSSPRRDSPRRESPRRDSRSPRRSSRRSDDRSPRRDSRNRSPAKEEKRSSRSHSPAKEEKRASRSPSPRADKSPAKEERRSPSPAPQQPAADAPAPTSA